MTAGVSCAGRGGVAAIRTDSLNEKGGLHMKRMNHTLALLLAILLLCSTAVIPIPAQAASGKATESIDLDYTSLRLPAGGLCVSSSTLTCAGRQALFACTAVTPPTQTLSKRGVFRSGFGNFRFWN